MNKNVLRKLSYGVYVVSTLGGDKSTGCIVNCAIQVTYDTMAISVNRDCHTNRCINESKKFAISILGEHVDDNIIPIFGFQSGKDVDKFKDIKTINLDGLAVLEDSVGYIVCELIDKMETDTHTIFLGKMVDGDVLKDDEPMTYAYYHQVKKGLSPKSAPTYMEEEPISDEVAYRCTVCGYIYHGDLTKEPDTYLCPICKKPKNVFEKI